MADLTRWRLECDNGRQVWKYAEQEAERVQSIMEKYFLGLDINDETKHYKRASNALEAARNGIEFYQQLQHDDGHWPNDYGGPMFLLPGLVITCYITGVDLGEHRRIQIIRYLQSQQRHDGGWGLHIESPSTIFGSALSYVVLRILGVPADASVTARGLEFLRSNGGAAGIPSWGKFWLAAVGLYDWRGLNPIPPEFWLLPYWLPIHPGRWWCHCRMVYLPMGYIYGSKATGTITPLIRQLRKELFVEDYDKIDWNAQRNYVSPLDMYTQHSRLIDFIHEVLVIYERHHIKWIRNKALEETLEQMRAEDRNTKYIDIGPVNKTINMLSMFHAYGKDSEYFRNHIPRLDDYLWLAADGMKMQGYNGSQLWDTAFCCQAIVETGLGEEFSDCITKINQYLESTQVVEEVPTPERHYRHISEGAWPFSTRDHGWPISDCTAEGLKACFSLTQFSFLNLLPDERLYKAVNVVLSLQNSGGGWATYELQRASGLTELLNPSETFHGIMVDYPYVECTSACVQALCKFRSHYPSHRKSEIANSVKRGVAYILGSQRADGSWKGSWGVCFTYAIWFGVEGLIAAGESAKHSAIRKACEFLVSKQRADGSWGESFQSCVKMEWVEHEEGQVVNTAWAVLTLLAAEYDQAVIKRGVQYLMSKQLDTGDWVQEGISGVFNANCAISYSGYKNIFSIWALGRYATRYPEDQQWW